MRTTVAAASTTVAALVLMKSYPAFSDPMAKQTTYGIWFHVKVHGNINQRSDLAFCQVTFYLTGSHDSSFLSNLSKLKNQPLTGTMIPEPSDSLPRKRITRKT